MWLLCGSGPNRGPLTVSTTTIRTATLPQVLAEAGMERRRYVHFLMGASYTIILLSLFPLNRGED